MLMRTNGSHRMGLLASMVLGSCLAAATAHAVSQAPTAFPITVDGAFSGGGEWSDVTPVAFNAGKSLTYTAVNAGKTHICLMYDELESVTDFGASLSGPVEFNVGAEGPLQEHFQVYFTDTGINVWRSVGGGDPVPFDVTTHDPDLMEGRRFLGTSPNSGTPHNMHELIVLLGNCDDPTLNCVGEGGAGPGLLSHGEGYSPDPAHWGASISDGPVPPRCVLPADSCGAGVPDSVDCETPGAISVIGDPVSNACVEIERGTGGVTHITRAGLPVPSTTPWGMSILVVLMLAAGLTLVMRRRQAVS